MASALLWTLASSFVTLADLANRGELAPEAAESLAGALVATLPDLVGRLAAPSVPSLTDRSSRSRTPSEPS